MGSIAKTARLMEDCIDPSKDPETGADRRPTGQPRFPDTTVTPADGKSVPFEQKYDRDSGGRSGETRRANSPTRPSAKTTTT